jgi:SAM-dependent methyltransferase
MGDDAAPRSLHPIFARYYARLSPQMDTAGLAAHRTALLDGLSGDVVEVGAGNGLNFARYPAAVTRVVAVEPEPLLRDAAVRAAATAAVPVQVVDGLAEALPLGDASVDVVVVSLVLCTVPDQAAALAEARRVLRPGGRLRFLEHVRAGSRRLARAQRVVDATFWPHLMGGCHTARDTVAAVEAAGFAVEALDRFRFPFAPFPTPAETMARGSAVRP